MFHRHLVGMTMQRQEEIKEEKSKSACNYLTYKQIQVITSTLQVSVQVCTSRSETNI